MSWVPCLCDHRIDDHFLLGSRRHGPCKTAGCACAEFRPTNRPPERPPPTG